jgi:acyl-CoA thioesterase
MKKELQKTFTVKKHVQWQCFYDLSLSSGSHATEEWQVVRATTQSERRQAPRYCRLGLMKSLPILEDTYTSHVDTYITGYSTVGTYY